MHFLILLIPIVLYAIGGQAALTLTVPITALLSVHSVAAAGGIIEGMSVAQKVEAVRLLITVADDAVKRGKQLAPLHHAILAKLQAGIAKLKVDAAMPHGGITAQHVGGPIGWGRVPVVFVYDPGHFTARPSSGK